MLYLFSGGRGFAIFRALQIPGVEWRIVYESKLGWSAWRWRGDDDVTFLDGEHIDGTYEGAKKQAEQDALSLVRRA